MSGMEGMRRGGGGGRERERIRVEGQRQKGSSGSQPAGSRRRGRSLPPAAHPTWQQAGALSQQAGATPPPHCQPATHIHLFVARNKKKKNRRCFPFPKHTRKMLTVMLQTSEKMTGGRFLVVSVSCQGFFLKYWNHLGIICLLTK